MIKLSQMPQMKVAFDNWFNQIQLVKIEQNVNNGLVEQTEVLYKFKGVIQPLSAREISLKPEGQRAFTWLQIHCVAGELNLDVNDRIIYNERKYKVMALKDYSLNNYIEYHLIEDFGE